MELEPDWSGLPPELLWEIACRIGSIEDLLEFKGVCKAWRSAASDRKVKFRKSSRIPLLMLVEKEGCDDREFYSPYKRRILMRLSLPELRGKRILEVKFGWLLTLTNSGEVTLLNPITRVQMDLPNYTTFPNYGDRKVFPPFCFIERAVLSQSPSDNPSNFVLFVKPNQMLGYWRAGDKNWTQIQPDKDMMVGDKNWTRIQLHKFICHTEYIEYYNNKLYMVHVDDVGIMILDFCGTGDFKVYIEIDYVFRCFAIYDDCMKYLVESSHGNLLFIARLYVRSESGDDYETKKFVVLEIDEMKGEWNVIDSLENDAIFIGASGAVSIPTGNFPDDTIKANCIYFTDDFWISYYNRVDEGGAGGGKDMGIFSMKDETIEFFNINDSVSVICPPLWIDSSIIMN